MNMSEMKPREVTAIVWIVGFEVLVFGLLVLSFILGEDRFGIQIATAICYSILVPIYAFVGGRLGRSYTLLDERSTRVFPRLVRLHIAFTVLLIVVQTIAFHLRERLPLSWREETGPKHDSWYGDTLIAFVVLIGMTEILRLRSILQRSWDESDSDNAN